MKGFKDFIFKGNVVDMAVAIVVGIAFNNLVQALVKDIITPLVGIPGKVDFSTLSFTINHSVFRYGDFINYMVSFLILAASVYFLIVKPFGKIMKTLSKPSDPVVKNCDFCLSEIPMQATKCAFCTSDIPAKTSV